MRERERDHRGDVVGPPPLGLWAVYVLAAWAAVAAAVAVGLWLGGAL